VVLVVQQVASVFTQAQVALVVLVQLVLTRLLEQAPLEVQQLVMEQVAVVVVVLEMETTQLQPLMVEQEALVRQVLYCCITKEINNVGNVGL
jgi:hypothetical protein